jgi:ABC-type transport system substrate-binding protein
LSAVVIACSAARCGNSGPTTHKPFTLRIGLGGVPQQTPQIGLRSLTANGSSEGLLSPQDSGRLRPWLAESWTVAPDGLEVTVQLRRNAEFHDGTPVTAPIVTEALSASLPGVMGPAFDDVKEISAADPWHVRITLRQPSQLVLEALEVPVQKPGKGNVGTGPYIPSPTNPSELLANPNYYLGRPNIDRFVAIPYTSVRAAWAELLRGNIDMLYETNLDALDSLQGSTDVGVYSYIRHYQYMIVFGAHSAVFRSPEIRRELSAAINREAIVKDALNGHGIPSTGPVPPAHWALEGTAPRLRFDPEIAGRLRSRHLKFTCLVPADSAYEPVALAVKQQLAAASVDMRVEEATQEQILHAAASKDFDALLFDPISGPSLFRSYRHWYSRMSFNPKPIESPRIDAALDRVRHATSDNEYRAGVSAFLQAIVDEPPALFLAWGERARAVSRKVDVVTEEKGRDPLINLRLWRPALQQVGHN